MDEVKLYDELVAHLDQGIMGTPKSPALIEILKILFPPDEAEIAAELPFENKTIAQLKEIYPDRADSLEETISRMVGRGTVFTIEKPGQDRTYRLLPSVVGWSETPFWAGVENDVVKKLAPLWLKYREEAFAEEFARGDMPIVRVVPVSKTLEESSDVLPYNALKPMVEKQSYCVVAKCPCRQIKKYAGEGCDHSLENCLHFGDMGKYMVEQGMGREISVEETLEILRASNEQGLVHISENLQGHMGTICNCCGCCCTFLDTKKKMGLHVFSPSSYVANVDADLCAACGTCEERCPMDAISMEDEVAVVDESVCIGCGVCTPTCDPEAIDLGLRSDAKPPPEVPEMLNARLNRS